MQSGLTHVRPRGGEVGADAPVYRQHLAVEACDVTEPPLPSYVRTPTAMKPSVVVGPVARLPATVNPYRPLSVASLQTLPVVSDRASADPGVLSPSASARPLCSKYRSDICVWYAPGCHVLSSSRSLQHHHLPPAAG